MKTIDELDVCRWPWKSVDSSSDYIDDNPACVTAKNGNVICSMTQNFARKQDAIARLIAAAPDLYEALLDMVIVFAPARTDEANRIIDQAKSALAKAAGEEPK